MKSVVSDLADKGWWNQLLHRDAVKCFHIHCTRAGTAVSQCKSGKTERFPDNIDSNRNLKL